MFRRPERPRRRSAAALFLILATCWAALPAALALPEDRGQPIRIEADEALRDEKQGFTRYRGHVRMQQGSLQIEADTIVVYHDNKQADRILAEGQPARLQQQPEPDKGLIKAHANVIEYFKNEDRVHLRQSAHIEQDGSIVTGDSIDYFITEQLVRADSDKTREDSRVQVVIPAAVVNKDSETRGAAESE